MIFSTAKHASRGSRSARASNLLHASLAFAALAAFAGASSPEGAARGAPVRPLGQTSAPPSGSAAPEMRVEPETSSESAASAGSRLNKAATERRSKGMNLEVAWERLREKLEKLNFVPRRRVATRPTRGSKKRRLEGKAHDAVKKATRQKPTVD